MPLLAHLRWHSCRHVRLARAKRFGYPHPYLVYWQLRIPPRRTGGIGTRHQVAIAGCAGQATHVISLHSKCDYGLALLMSHFWGCTAARRVLHLSPSPSSSFKTVPVREGQDYKLSAHATAARRNPPSDDGLMIAGCGRIGPLFCVWRTEKKASESVC